MLFFYFFLNFFLNFFLRATLYYPLLPFSQSLCLYLCTNSLGRFSYLFALFISWRCFRFWQRQTLLLLPLFAFVTKINALALICRLQIANGHAVFHSPAAPYNSSV